VGVSAGNKTSSSSCLLLITDHGSPITEILTAGGGGPADSFSPGYSFDRMMFRGYIH
jgi:hypothetical protein